jgi:RecJ-like exonuclease
VKCSSCHGTGHVRNGLDYCPSCDGTGWLEWTDVIVPWVLALLVAGVALSVVEWLWHLFTK